MFRNQRTVAAVFAILLGAGEAAGAGLVMRLTDGSQVTAGEIASADEASLTVASVGAGARIERTVPWNRIATAALDGQAYSKEELRSALGLAVGVVAPVSHVRPVPMRVRDRDQGADAPRSPCVATPCLCSDIVPRRRRVGRVIGVRPDPLAAYPDLIPATYPAGVPSSEAPFALGVLRERRRIETINPFLPPFAGGFVPPLDVLPPTGDVVPGVLSQIEARVRPLRLGGTADVNALGVTLVGLDAAGNAVPLDGTAEFSLFAGRQRLVRAFDDVYAPQPEGLIRLAEWTRSVRPDASLVLRLPEPLPDQDPNVSANGSLRVRLSAPGRGVFEAVSEPVALRPLSPLRDAVRSETGSRFLPDEQTSGRRDTTWPHRQP